ncbi:MAG: hypothetical protein ACOYN6_00260 [Ignavibacteria bacterium]
MKIIILTALIFLVAFTLTAQTNNTNIKVTKASPAISDFMNDKTSSDIMNTEYEQSRAVKAEACILYKLI